MKLYQHQITGIDFLKEKGRAILADSMGLGKTIQAIVASVDNHGNVLVVCPASIKTNWLREIRGYREEDDIIVVSGRKHAPGGKFEATEGVKTWFIINYDILSAHKDAILASDHLGTLILDESHYIKGNSIRAKAAIEIAKKITNVYCLTGTPLLNRPIELFNQLRAIGHPLGLNRTVFARRYCGAFFMQQMINNYTGKKIVLPQNSAYNLNRQTWRIGFRFLNESGATNLVELRDKVKECMLRRKKEEVLDLPPKIIDIMEVDLSEEQRREYDGAWDKYLEHLKAEADSEKIQNSIDAKEMVELTKLKQVCSLAKVERVIEDILNAIDQEEKIIVFSQYTETIRQIAERLKDKKVGYAVLTGQTKQEDRQRAIDSFQEEEKTKVFIANIKAGGIGINLTKAGVVIFADMEWSPEIHAQAEDRAHRIGQTGTVNIYYYVCKDTVEEDIIELLVNKKRIVQEVIDGTKQRIKTSSIMSEFAKRMANRLVDN